MRQFEIWWADLPAPVGRRAVLLLSCNNAYQYLAKFIVAEITTAIRAIPVEVRLGRCEGLPSVCAANLDNLRTVARQWLDTRAGALAIPAFGSETGVRVRTCVGRINRSGVAGCGKPIQAADERRSTRIKSLVFNPR